MFGVYIEAPTEYKYKSIVKTVILSLRQLKWLYNCINFVENSFENWNLTYTKLIS